MAFLEMYHYVNTDLADARTNDWPLISSPLYPIALIIGYLYVVLGFLPKFMQYRKPYELKKFIVAYNIYQVVACSYITYGMVKSGWSTHYNWFCQPTDYSNNPESVRMAKLCWLLMIVKVSEFIETMIFALRKKNNQISFLHVYHHSSTLIFIWLGVKYYPGGSYTFPPILNSSVHVIMYTYYLLSLIKKPWLQKPLLKFKPFMTQIQMGQFVLLLLYAAQAFRPSCNLPKTICLFFVPNVFVVFYLFYDFYQKNFNKQRKTT